LNCQEALRLLHGYLDGELDLVNSLQIEQHLQDCRSCALEQANDLALRQALRGGELYFKPPEALAGRVRLALAAADIQAPAPRRAPARPLGQRWRWLGVALALAAVVIVTWGLARGLANPPADTAIAQQVVASHIRSLMPDHLTDVASTDQHTVKPWFAGKLDFSPPVVDLADQGFPLIGGRLDYLDNRPVAALVYRHQQHLINLFIWPSTSAAGAQLTVDQGYQVEHWAGSGMTFWAISDMAAAELQTFVQLLQQQTGT
jgi:anti-sigma factor RsiW